MNENTAALKNNALGRIIRALNRLIYWATVLAFANFFIMVLASVVSRYVLRTPILGAVEMSRLAFVWACFLAAAIAYRQKAHIVITVFADRLPASVQFVLSKVVLLLTLILSATLLYAAIDVTRTLWHSQLPILQISQGWFYVPVCICAFYILIYSTRFLFEKQSEPPSA